MQNFLSEQNKKIIEEIYNIKISSATPYIGAIKNQAFSSDIEIFLGVYSSAKIEALCLFHELGHIVSNKNKSNEYFICKMSQESMAWEVAIELIIKHKDLFDFEFNLNEYKGEELTFMRQCLKTYIENGF